MVLFEYVDGAYEFLVYVFFAVVGFYLVTFIIFHRKRLNEYIIDLES